MKLLFRSNRRSVPAGAVPLFLFVLALCTPSSRGFAAPAGQGADPGQVEFFEKAVRPLLEEHCIECHSAAKGKTKGGLALDNAAATLKGGDTGPALVAGSAEKSLLLKAVSYKDEDLKMPPDNKRLSAEQVAVLEQWIKSGAYDPREGKALGPDKDAAKRHWAFQAVHWPIFWIDASGSLRPSSGSSSLG